jgi:hypothetical protein
LPKAFNRLKQYIDSLSKKAVSIFLISDNWLIPHKDYILGLAAVIVDSGGKSSIVVLGNSVFNKFKS